VKILQLLFIWLALCAVSGLAAAAITVFHPL